MILAGTFVSMQSFKISRKVVNSLSIQEIANHIGWFNIGLSHCHSFDVLLNSPIVISFGIQMISVLLEDLCNIPLFKFLSFREIDCNCEETSSEQERDSRVEILLGQLDNLKYLSRN